MLPPILQTVVEKFKRLTARISHLAQAVLLPLLLTFLYFVGFGLFAPAGRIFASRMNRKTRISPNSEWHLPQYGDLTRNLDRQS